MTRMTSPKTPRLPKFRLPKPRLPKTLRGRLIAGLVALLAVACATVGLVTYLAVQSSLTRELRGELQTATGLAYNCWETQARTAGGGTAQPPRQHAAGPGATRQADWTMPGTGPAPAPGSGPASPDPLPPKIGECSGLADGTIVAVSYHGQWKAAVIGDADRDGDAEGDGGVTLPAADRRTLLAMSPWSAPSPHNGWPASAQVPTAVASMTAGHGTYEFTAVRDPDRDGTVYYTGLPLSALHDMLSDVALVEAVVFSSVLLLAGVLGTVWVGLSLRPLRRVASTASQVAELPLETGEVSLPEGVPDTDPATETGQVGLAFNRMLGHVQTALRRRAASEVRLRRFAADASHELRTPLAAIRGYAELALRHPGDTPEAVTHALRRVLSESTRMSVLVDDLLLLARLDAGRPLSRAPVDLTRLAIDATSDARVARPGHRWVLELPDDSVLVSGDEHRLYQVLANLLSNAGRHTPDGTTVTVRVGGTLADSEPGQAQPAGTAAGETIARGTLPAPPRVTISVTDDGPGIPPDLLPELFERFTRADSSRSHAVNASSTGLGLAIVDAVVAAHHGAVMVRSRPGMTRFTIVFAQLAEPAATRGPGAGPAILSQR
jgi:two-component system OmpR family sensor kinase